MAVAGRSVWKVTEKKKIVIFRENTSNYIVAVSLLWFSVNQCENEFEVCFEQSTLVRALRLIWFYFAWFWQKFRSFENPIIILGTTVYFVLFNPLLISHQINFKHSIPWILSFEANKMDGRIKILAFNFVEEHFVEWIQVFVVNRSTIHISADCLQK